MNTFPSALAALVLALWSFAPGASAAPYVPDQSDLWWTNRSRPESAQSIDPAGGWMTSVESGARSPGVSAAPTPAASGMKVFIDPQTRQLRRPDTADIESLAAKSPRGIPRVAPQVRANPNGSLSAVLDDSFASDLIATRQADGTLRLDCLPAKAAAAVVNNPGLRSVDIARRSAADEQ